jgi:hypothetical protein
MELHWSCRFKCGADQQERLATSANISKSFYLSTPTHFDYEVPVRARYLGT